MIRQRLLKNVPGLGVVVALGSTTPVEPLAGAGSAGLGLSERSGTWSRSQEGTAAAGAPAGAPTG